MVNGNDYDDGVVEEVAVGGKPVEERPPVHGDVRSVCTREAHLLVVLQQVVLVVRLLLVEAARQALLDLLLLDLCLPVLHVVQLGRIAARGDPD